MSVLLLNHFNGSDGATTFTDEVAGITWSRRSSLGEIDTAQAKFGSSGLLGPVVGTSLQIQGSGFTSPHAGSWTIEGFFRVAASDGSVTFYGNDGSDNFQIAANFLSETNSGDANTYSVDLYDSSSGTIWTASSSASVTNNTWHHVAIVRDATGGGTYSLYFDGSRLATTSSGTNVRSFDRVQLNANGSSTNHWFDEVRVTDEAKYSGTTYTVPTAEFALTAPGNFERHWELQPVDIIPIGVQSAEFGREIYPVARYQVTVQSAEFEREKTSVSISKNIPVNSAEFDREILTLPLSVVPAGSEYEWEARAAAIITACPVNAEFDFEITSGELPSSITVNPHAAEFTFELQPIDIIPIGVQSAEFDREIQAVSIGYLGVTTGEWDREFYSLPVTLNLNAQSAEYGREIEGVGGTAPSSTNVFSGEFEREHSEAILAKNVVVTNYEKGYELRPVDIVPVRPAASDYGREIANAQLVANSATPASAEFERAHESVFLSFSGNPTVVAQNAEFGYEFQPITNIFSVDAEFDTEIASVYIEERSGIVEAPEFDWEASSVAITIASNTQPDNAEFGYEAQSAQISLNIPVVGVEFEREFGSAQISAVIIPQSGEFDYEVTDPEVVQGIGKNEYDYQAGSPALSLNVNADSSEYDHEITSVRFPETGEIESFSPEYTWESGKVRLRYFHRRAKTPRMRVKHVRQI